MNITNNTIRWIRIAIEGAFLAVFVILCIAVAAKNRAIKQQKAALKGDIETIADIQAYADSLAKLECVTVNNTVVINQKGLVNTTQANQISKTVATYTREEVLHALDSINKTK